MPQMPCHTARHRRFLPLVITCLLAGLMLQPLPARASDAVARLCKEIGSTLGSVTTKNCLAQNFVDSKATSALQRPLVLKEYAPLASREPLGRVLLLGGIHGDEYSSVSLVFRWLEKLDRHHSGLFHWQVIPLLNPDGLFQQPKATRQNGNGVDLNRNFPTGDWNDLALKYWAERTSKSPRRYPGPSAASEPETRWFMQQIEQFQPHAIITVHAPHQLVDFDGPQEPPINLGKLKLRRLGTYPGSLGNYGASALDIPVLTLELASAGIMPTDAEVNRMWGDLVNWLRSEVPKQRAAVEEKQKQTNANKAVARNP